MDYQLLKMKIMSNEPLKMDFVPLMLNILNIPLREFTLKAKKNFLKVNFSVDML